MLKEPIDLFLGSVPCAGHATPMRELTPAEVDQVCRFPAPPAFATAAVPRLTPSEQAWATMASLR